MDNVPAWLQLIGGACLGLIIIGGMYTGVQSTLTSLGTRMTAIEDIQKENKYLSDRVLVVEQWKKKEESRSERDAAIQEKLADAIQSLSVSVARLDERVQRMDE